MFRVTCYPVHYEEDLESDISRRSQRYTEPAADYIIDLLRSLICRHGSLMAKQETLRMNRNLLPEYRQYIRGIYFWDTPSLVSKIREYENLREELRHSERSQPSTRHLVSFDRNLSPIPSAQNVSSSTRGPSREPTFENRTVSWNPKNRNI
ncbi:hypothetical protein JTB14_025417 [Gonioctena quinquepunctata]|nr:hypothetical protein JTB14_025417 [Gonioctena quinquepunctata]